MKMNHKVNHLDNKMREGLPLYSGDISKLSYDKERQKHDILISFIYNLKTIVKHTKK